MNSRQYTLIVAVVVIVVLGLFFVITSRNSDVIIENPNTESPIQINTATSTGQDVTASSTITTGSASTTKSQ